MKIFTSERTIDAPVDAVWRHLCDPALMGRWMPGVTEMRSTGGAPLALHSTIIFKTRGADHGSIVVVFDDGRAIALRSTQGPFTATYRYDIEPAGAGTRVRLVADCASSGFGRLIAPLVRRMIRRTDAAQLDRLADTIGAGGW